MNWLLLKFIKVSYAQSIQPGGQFTPGGQITPGGQFTPGGQQTPSTCDPSSEGFNLCNPLRGTLFDLIDNIMGFLMVAGAVVLPFVIIYAAFQMMTAGGDPEKFQTGKKTILYAVIGYGIILLSRGLVYVIAGFFGVNIQTP